MLNLNTAVKELEKIEDSINLGKLFLAYQLLYVLDRDPRQEAEAKKKYPKHLVPSRQQTLTEKGFYAWNIPKSKTKLTLFLIIGVLIAIGFMLFSLWPLWLKIGIWYLSFYTLIVLVGFILLRLFVWLFLFHFGLDFWIFPNFFIDSSDIMDSFRPMLSFERRQDDMKMMLLRLLSAVSLIFLVIQLAKEPENLDSLSSFTNESMNDFFNWGNDKFVLGKIEDKSGNGTARRKKTPQEIFMEAIMDDEEPAKKVEETPKVAEEEETQSTKMGESEEESVLDRDAIGGADDSEETDSKPVGDL